MADSTKVVKTLNLVMDEVLNEMLADEMISPEERKLARKVGRKMKERINKSSPWIYKAISMINK